MYPKLQKDDMVVKVLAKVCVEHSCFMAFSNPGHHKFIYLFSISRVLWHCLMLDSF